MHSDSDKTDNWIFCKSNKQLNRKYYFNTSTGESIWEQDWKGRKQNVDSDQGLISSNLSPPETTEIKKEIHSPLEDTSQSENLTPSTYEDLTHSMDVKDNRVGLLQVFSRFDLRELLVFRKPQMDHGSSKNLAHRRMQRLREQLNANINQNNNAPAMQTTNKYNLTEFTKSYVSEESNANQLGRNVTSNQSSSKECSVNDSQEYRNLKRRRVDSEEHSKSGFETKRGPARASSYNNSVANNNNNSTQFKPGATENIFIKTNGRPNNTNIAENSQKLNKKFSANNRLQSNSRNISEDSTDNISSGFSVENRKANNYTNNRINSHTAIIPRSKFSVNDRLQRIVNNGPEAISNTFETASVENNVIVTSSKSNNDKYISEESQKAVRVANSQFSANEEFQQNANSMSRNHDKYANLPPIEPLLNNKRDESKGKEIYSRGNMVEKHASHSSMKNSFENGRNKHTGGRLNSELAKSCSASGFANSRLKTYRESLLEGIESSNNANAHEVLTPEDVVMEQDYEDNSKNHYASCSQENMEWETITEEKVLQSVHNIRKELFETSFSPEVEYRGPSTNEINVEDDVRPRIVVDTNIFLSHLEFVKYVLLEYNYENLGHPIIIIPWIVLQELDYIKDRQSKLCEGTGKLAILARQAISFLNGSIVNKSPQLYAQNAVESSRELFHIDTSDDKILNCCLQMKEKARNVYLLSNDQNLRTKAAVNNIPAYSRDEFVESVKKLQTNGKHTTSHSEQRDVSSQQCSNFGTSDVYLKERSVIAKAPNMKLIKMLEDNGSHKEIEEYLTCILLFYKQYCQNIMEVSQKLQSGDEIDENSVAIVEALPELKSALSKFLDIIPQVTILPHFHVKIESLDDFTRLLMNFLFKHGGSRVTITMKDIGSFCRVERDKILAFDTRLKCANEVLREFQDTATDY